MTDPLRSATRAAPETTALGWPGGACTYADLDARADRLAAALAAHGLDRGDRLLLHAPTSPEAVALLWACWRSGIVLAPTGPRWPAAAARARAAAIAAALFLDADGLAALANAGPHRRDDYYGGDYGEYHRDISRRYGADAAIPHIPPPTLSATIIWTSGSSGVPKAAVHSTQNHLASARGVTALLGMDAQSRYLLTLPLASVGGLAVAVRCACACATLVLPEAGEPLGTALRRTEASHVSLVSTHLVRLLGEAEADGVLAQLRGVLLGGSAMPPHAIEEAARRGLRIAPSYGLTEMASTVAAVRPGAGAEALATSGRVLPHRALRVDAEGEIHVHGPTRFLGYLDGTHALHEPFDARGWFATGDLGTVDAQGRLRVTGRRGTRFVSGGANVQPEVIEAALLTHPAVRRAAVVPIPSATYGQRPVAFVEVEAAHAEGLTRSLARDLDRAVRAHLPGFMAPDGYHLWPAEGATLPGGSKPDRTALRIFLEALPENEARGLTIS